MFSPFSFPGFASLLELSRSSLIPLVANTADERFELARYPIAGIFVAPWLLW
jgi:hypothetical protein